MRTWNAMINWVSKWKTESETSRSNVRSLIRIFQKARSWNMEPELLHRVTRSNLREIIRPAKRAIRDGDKKQLEELFIAAASMTTTDLRNLIRRTDLERVAADKIIRSNRVLYRLDVTEEQLERIMRSTKRSLKFSIEEEQDDTVEHYWEH